MSIILTTVSPPQTTIDEFTRDGKMGTHQATDVVSELVATTTTDGDPPKIFFLQQDGITVARSTEKGEIHPPVFQVHPADSANGVLDGYSTIEVFYTDAPTKCVGQLHLPHWQSVTPPPSGTVDGTLQMVNPRQTWLSPFRLMKSGRLLYEGHKVTYTMSVPRITDPYTDAIYDISLSPSVASHATNGASAIQLRWYLYKGSRLVGFKKTPMAVDTVNQKSKFTVSEKNSGRVRLMIVATLAKGNPVRYAIRNYTRTRLYQDTEQPTEPLSSFSPDAKRRAVVIGISDYRQISDLSYCDEDSTKACQFLKAPGFQVRLFGDDTSPYPFVARTCMFFYFFLPSTLTRIADRVCGVPFLFFSVHTCSLRVGRAIMK